MLNQFIVIIIIWAIFVLTVLTWYLIFSLKDVPSLKSGTSGLTTCIVEIFWETKKSGGNRSFLGLVDGGEGNSHEKNRCKCRKWVYWERSFCLKQTYFEWAGKSIEITKLKETPLKRRTRRGPGLWIFGGVSLPNHENIMIIITMITSWLLLQW